MSSDSLPEKLVKRYGTRDPYRIAEAMNIKIHHLSHLESSCPGLTCLVANRPSIFLNDAYFERMRRRMRAYNDLMAQYDMAQVTGHELGHCVLHKDEFRQAPIKEYEIFTRCSAARPASTRCRWTCPPPSEACSTRYLTGNSGRKGGA